MKFLTLSLPLSLGTLFLAASSQAAPASSSVQELIGRVTPQSASQFRVEPLAGGSNDTFEIAGSDGKIVLRGSTPVAQASAYGWYLKHVADAHLSWGGDQLNLPAHLKAPAAPIRLTTPYALRYAFNYCTLSYSAAFWDWNRWQRELDFESMNGFNQILVTAA